MKKSGKMYSPKVSNFQTTPYMPTFPRAIGLGKRNLHAFLTPNRVIYTHRPVSFVAKAAYADRKRELMYEGQYLTN